MAAISMVKGHMQTLYSAASGQGLYIGGISGQDMERASIQAVSDPSRAGVSTNRT